MPRGLPPTQHREVDRGAHQSRGDMFRETYPDDLDVDMRPVPRATPSALVIVLPIGLGLVTLVLVAALHAALGEPLGAGWAAEVWSMVKAAVWPAIACASIGLYVRRQQTDAAHALGQATADQAAIAQGSHRPRTGGHPRLSTGGHRVIQIELTDSGEDEGDDADRPVTESGRGRR